MNREEEIMSELSELHKELQVIRDKAVIELSEHLKEHGPMMFYKALKKFKIEKGRLIWSKIRRHNMITMTDFQNDRWLAHKDNAPRPQWR